jgi:Ser/Thr protein kinase RdoA (MazF antagonist)|tara:strand:- start:868 stop:1863 length:996 start_codon:yes stop_codon:yes gene_type:complete
MENSTDLHPFETLDPSFLLDAVDSVGFETDGRVTILNSYENRVYQIGIEDSEPVIAKFYRPGRWSNQQIQEEHDYCYELVDAELPVVAPIKNDQDISLFEHGNFRFSLYPRKGGRAPELDNLDNLFILGRFLGRIHMIGASSSFKTRPTINSQSYGHESVEYIKENFIPSDLRVAYESLTDDLLKIIDPIMNEASDIKYIRAHGDCHIGNMLWRDELPHFIDFDDSRMAPAVQDVWMLLSGDRNEQQMQLREIIEGYNEFADFDLQELRLIESLRTLRMLHHSAWLARRWDDPAFPLGFPWFNTPRYWEEQILNMREQLSGLREPTMTLFL